MFMSVRYVYCKYETRRVATQVHQAIDADERALGGNPYRYPHLLF
jgi:hypothetical protein